MQRRGLPPRTRWRICLVTDDSLHFSKFSFYTNDGIFHQRITLYVYTNVNQSLFSLGIHGAVKLDAFASWLRKNFSDDIFSDSETSLLGGIFILKIFHHFGAQFEADGS